MATNIQINYYNGSSYVVLYPETLGSLVSGTVSSATTASSCSGNSATATKLASTFAIRTNLASTSYAYVDGSTTVAPGVTGTLPVARGGTGVTSLSSLASSLSSYMDGVSVYSGSYTGTELYGKNNKTTVNINTGKVYLFIVQNNSYVGLMILTPISGDGGTISGNGYYYTEVSQAYSSTLTQLSWYSTQSAQYQMNKSWTYYWYAIGA